MLALAAFIRQELRTQAPVFDVRLFVDNKLFAFSSFAALINYAATFAVTFLLSLYLQYIKGMSPQGAGTLLVVQPACMALFSPFAGKLSDRIEPRRIASAGMALTALGLVQLALLTMASSRIHVVTALLTLGIGFALFSSPNMNAIMGAVAKRHYGSASGTVSTMRLLGQMMSMAMATIVFALLLGDQQIVPQTFPAFMESVKICFSAFAAICFVGIFFSLFRGDLRQYAEPDRPTE
jgi:MFS family permease